MKLFQFATNEETGKKLTFKDIDEPLQKKFLLKFFGSGIIFVVGIPFSIMFKSWTVFAMITVAALILTSLTAIQVLNMLMGNVVKIEGAVYRYDKAGKRKKEFVRNTLYLKMDDGSYICLHPNNSFSAEEGNRIVVYTPVKALYKKSEDVYEIGEYYHIQIVKMFS